jgi:hypothetical protein
MFFLSTLFSNIRNLRSWKHHAPQRCKINDLECFEADVMITMFNVNNKHLLNLPSWFLHNEASVAEKIGNFWAYIREMLGSSLCRDTGYPDWVFVVLFSRSGKC